MLDIKKTLYKTIWNKLQDLRFLGKQNPEIFRAIISLIIVDDLYDWADYLEETQGVQKFLKEWRTNHITKNCFYEKVSSNDMFYTNVNIPQTNYTFRDTWDALDVVSLYDPIVPISTPCEMGWEEDPTYTPQLVYYHREPGGHPNLIIGNLSIHERMNVYINKVNNTVWVIEPGSCEWTQLTINNEADISDKIAEYLENNPVGLTSSWSEVDPGSVTIQTAQTGEVTLQSMSSDEITNIFTE